MDFEENKHQLLSDGFTIIENIYSAEEVQNILGVIENADTSKDSFRKSTELFAIRQFIKEVPASFDLLFTTKFKALASKIMGDDFFVVKSIYFDKPETSNWYVSYHQDLTISVDKKLEFENFSHWTTKQNQYSVRPPINILENITTIRIHLDDTDMGNGALKVIPKSHLNGVCRPETQGFDNGAETSCQVQLGGVMLMKPLIMHSSSRTTNSRKRRVIHIEFSNKELPEGLQWAERINL